MTNVFTYTIINATTGEKMIGGSLRAPDLEGAAQEATHRCNLTVHASGTKRYPRWSWTRNGVKVFLVVHISADRYLSDDAKYLLDDLPD